MIPSNKQYVARYKIEREKGPTYYDDRPVVAWGDDGEALVVDARRGRLVSADSFSNFVGLDTESHRVVAAIPADGWAAVFSHKEGTLTTDPLIAWLVRSNGSVTPAGMSRDGVSDDPTMIGNFVQLIAPGEEPEQPDSE